MRHPPLSQSLEQFAANHQGQEGVTLNEMLERTEGRGVYLLIILLCLPFVTPLPLPGVSSVLGVVIFILALRLALHLPPHLPKSIGARSLPLCPHSRWFKASLKFVKFVEKWARPRGSVWMTWRLTHTANAALIAFMALLLLLPLPLPFTNTVPCYAIILVAASMMEEDGILVWFGYGVSLGAVVYFLLIGGTIVAVFAEYYGTILRFLHLAP